MNKKLVAALISLSLSVSVVGCSKKSKTSQDDKVNLAINIESMQEESIGKADTFIKLGDRIDVDGEGATVSDNKIIISSAGTYSVSGSIADGQIIINSGDEDNVYLILDNADITCKNSSPIYNQNSKKLIIATEKDSKNTITDGQEYVLEDEKNNEPNGAIFSKDDLVFIGSGKLNVNGNYNHGIVSKDKLKLQSGTIVVKSKNDGIKGKDCVNLTEANVSITSGGDGMQANNDTDTTKGYILIEGGKINIESDEDGIQAETQLLIKDGDITINSGGGSKKSNKLNSKGGMPGGGEIPSGNQMQGELPNGEPPQLPNNEAQNSSTNTEDTTVSSKALKATTNIIVEGGTIEADSLDDTIHSDKDITISGGKFNLTSGDDGIHSESNLNISGGTINILNSYEALESEVINISGGSTSVVAVDDGLNASEGATGDSTDSNTNSSNSNEQKEKPQGKMGGMEEVSEVAKINISDGYLYVDAAGDGVDSNGDTSITGGVVIVNGPENGGNAALDCAGEFVVDGGTIVAAGSLGMVEKLSDKSKQSNLNIALKSQESNTLINISTASGENLITFAPSKTYSSVIVSTPNIKSGTEYKVSVGGTSTGTSKDGLYTDGKYSGGEEIGSEKVSNITTSISQDGVSTSNSMSRPGGGQGGFGGREEDSSSDSPSTSSDI